MSISFLAWCATTRSEGDVVVTMMSTSAAYLALACSESVTNEEKPRAKFKSLTPYSFC